MAIPDVTPCSFVDANRLFRTASIFYLEDISVIFLQTYGTNFQIIRQYFSQHRRLRIIMGLKEASRRAVSPNQLRIEWTQWSFLWEYAVGVPRLLVAFT